MILKLLAPDRPRSLKEGFVNTLHTASNPILSRAAWNVTSYHMAILDGGSVAMSCRSLQCGVPHLCSEDMYILCVQHNRTLSSHFMNKTQLQIACVKIDVISEAEGRWNRHDQCCKKSTATNCTWEWRTASTTYTMQEPTEVSNPFVGYNLIWWTVEMINSIQGRIHLFRVDGGRARELL